jgi:acetyl-CoA carboxylase carboxyl transferase subunit beta
MQMAKTSAKLSILAEKKIPYISILTDPTTGGVTASYAMLGDINIAEPNALIGFAGPRIVKETIGKDLPDGFQKSEFVQEHGFLDFIVERKDMKTKVSQFISMVS